MSALARLREGPLAAFVELRLRLGLRRLRGRAGVPELVAKVASYVLVAPAAVVMAVLVGAGTQNAAQVGRGLTVDTTVAAVLFGIWQTWTVVSISVQEREGLDLGRFLVYPLPAGRIFTYGVAASVVGDPFALFWCVLLAGAWGGAAVGRPGAWLIGLAAVLLLFAAATAVNIFLLQEILGRLLRRKGARAMALALLYAVLAFGGAFLAGLRHGGAGLERLRAIAAVGRWLFWPAALAAASANPLFKGQPIEALWPAACSWPAGSPSGSTWGAPALAGQARCRLRRAGASGGPPSGCRAGSGRSWSAR
jgi:ABC-2 type transport system permease protein